MENHEHYAFIRALCASLTINNPEVVNVSDYCLCCTRLRSSREKGVETVEAQNGRQVDFNVQNHPSARTEGDRQVASCQSCFYTPSFWAILRFVRSPSLSSAAAYFTFSSNT